MQWLRDLEPSPLPSLPTLATGCSNHVLVSDTGVVELTNLDSARVDDPRKTAKRLGVIRGRGRGKDKTILRTFLGSSSRKCVWRTSAGWLWVWRSPSFVCVCVCVRVRVCVCLCGCACVCVGVWVCRDTPVVAAGSNLPFLAPEILMGCRWHSQAADIWAVGCVLAHLHLGKPLLAGKDVRHHLLHIFKVCGSPAIAYVAVLVCVRVRGVLFC